MLFELTFNFGLNRRLDKGTILQKQKIPLSEKGAEFFYEGFLCEVTKLVSLNSLCNSGCKPGISECGIQYFAGFLVQMPVKHCFYFREMRRMKTVPERALLQQMDLVAAMQ